MRYLLLLGVLCVGCGDKAVDEPEAEEQEWIKHKNTEPFEWWPDANGNITIGHNVWFPAPPDTPRTPSAGDR